MAISGGSQDRKADLTVPEIEAMLTARGKADRRDFPGRTPFDDQPPAMDVLLAVGGTPDRPGRDLGEERRVGERRRQAQLQAPLFLVPCHSEPEFENGP